MQFEPHIFPTFLFLRTRFLFSSTLPFTAPFPSPHFSASYGLGKKHIIEGSLEVKLPTIWTDEKQSREEAERRERLEERRVEEKE